MRRRKKVLLLAAIQVELFHAGGEAVSSGDEDLLTDYGELLNALLGFRDYVAPLSRVGIR